MFNLFFGDLFSTLTTILVAFMLIFATTTAMNQQRIKHWGWRILFFVLIGLAISGLSATRDAYMTEVALFTPEGLQSIICSVAGGLIFLTAIATIFLRKQEFRKNGFYFIAVLFLIQVVTIEVSRIAML